MLKNLLRRFGYYKLNIEDKLALAKHYNLRFEGVWVFTENEHSKYLQIDPFTCIALACPKSKINVSYTCDQPDDVV